MARTLSECEDLILKYEKLINNINDACLCNRFQTKGFDYGEDHPRLGNEIGSRFNTPRDMIEGTIGFKWKYKDKKKPGNSWKELQFVSLENKKEGFY